MIKSITITNHLNESITLEMTNPERSGFVIRFIDGLGSPKANVEMTEMSLMDGAVYNSARAQSRNIVLSLMFLFPSAAAGNLQSQFGNLEITRQKSYKYFPLKTRVKITIETDERSCEVYGYVESNIPEIFSKDGGTIISILCPDSYLFSTHIYATNFSYVSDLFEFPFSNESLTVKLLEFSTINHYTQRTITYPGDAEIGMVMSIHAVGAIENITIYKLYPEPVETIEIDTDRLLAMTGEGLHLGDDIIISTVKGNKYAILIRDGEITNILNCLAKYPDWIQISRGDNVFSIAAEVGVENLQFKIENQIAYEGI
jgi:hypothetical protein